MFPALRQYLINELLRGIGTIGPTFEAFSQRFVDHLVDLPMQHRGLNSEGQPVGHTVDSVSEQGEVAAEYSAEQDYFEWPFKKIFKDLRHVRKLHPQAINVLLISSRESGPKAATRLTNLRARLKTCVGIDVKIFDARRISEHIVDTLLLNDRAVDELAQYLAPLSKVRDQFALTNLLPAVSLGHIARPVFYADIAKRIRTDRVVGLAGISGSGKSETAAAVAHAIAGKYDMVVWLPCSAITDLNDLCGVDIERRGHKVNLLQLLKDHSCLALFDDLRTPISRDELSTYCGQNSSILITRQSSHIGDIPMPFMDPEDSRQLLEHGIATKCPDDILATVEKTVGGHPLALRLMNAGVRNGTWEDLRLDCAAIGDYRDEDRTQRLADRLLGRLRGILERIGLL